MGSRIEEERATKGLFLGLFEAGISDMLLVLLLVLVLLPGPTAHGQAANAAGMGPAPYVAVIKVL